MADSDKDMAKLFLTMADLSGEEQKLARQQAMSDQLRAQAFKTPSGKDWASQAATAMAGVGSALSQMKTRRAEEAYGKSRQGILDRAMAMFGGGGGIPKYPISPPPDVQQPEVDLATLQQLREQGIV